MCYIGNDVLSIKDRSNQKSFSNQKFLRKILTDKELYCLQDSDFCFQSYLFWTCKESAYKIAVKKGYNLAFVPQYFEVVSHKVQTEDNISIITGSISFEETLFYFRSKITTDFVSTIASEHENELSYVCESAGIYIEGDYSLLMKTSLKKEVSEHFSADPEHFRICKNQNGVPYLCSTINKIMPDISFSHDGPYYAYALLYSRP
ncbi:MAG: 4'-phosphopantetheinyl transferase superfamily protein [Bacteroidota bacterium]